MLTLLELLVLDLEGTKLLHKSHLFAFGESCGQIVDLKSMGYINVAHANSSQLWRKKKYSKYFDSNKD